MQSAIKQLVSIYSRLEDFFNPGSGTATKEIEYSSESDFWHDLVAELIKQGFSLGVKLKMPLNNDIEEFPEYEEKKRKC